MWTALLLKMAVSVIGLDDSKINYIFCLCKVLRCIADLQYSIKYFMLMGIY